MNSNDIVNEILKRQMARNQVTGVNAQKLLDTHWFRGLSYEDQKKFIETHKSQLSRDPSFSWKPIGLAAAELGGIGAISTLGYQLGTKGLAGVAKNPYGAIAAGILGALVGATSEYTNSTQDRNRDLETKRNIDDAIEVLMRRIDRPAITRLNLEDRIKKDMLDVPSAYGKRLVDHPVFYQNHVHEGK